MNKIMPSRGPVAGNTFAFIIHPFHRDDLFRKLKPIRRLPAWAVDRLLWLFPPTRVGEINGPVTSHSRVKGHLVSANLTAEQMLSLPFHHVIKKIINAGRLAQRLGARIVGLNGMVAAVGDAGVTVARNLGIAVTNGGSYTVAAAVEGSCRALRSLGRELADVSVMVIGAAGSPGSICARLLAREGVNYLTLAAPDRHRLDNLARRILYETGVSCKVTSQLNRSARRADLIIRASAAGIVLKPEELKPGAVVCDLAWPRDISIRVARRRSDLFIIDGGFAEVPGSISEQGNTGLPPYIIPAAMAETMILALEGRFESYSLGRELRIGKVEEIRRLAVKHGFSVVFNHGAGRMDDPHRHLLSGNR